VRGPALHHPASDGNYRTASFEIHLGAQPFFDVRKISYRLQGSPPAYFRSDEFEMEDQRIIPMLLQDLLHTPSRPKPVTVHTGDKSIISDPYFAAAGAARIACRPGKASPTAISTTLSCRCADWIVSSETGPFDRAEIELLRPLRPATCVLIFSSFAARLRTGVALPQPSSLSP